VDCAAGDCDGDVEEEPCEGELAVVHSVLLCRGGAGELCAALCSGVGQFVFRAVPVGAGGVNGGAVSDWDGHYKEHVEGGGDAAPGPGGFALDRGGEPFAVGDPCGMDCAVGGRLSRAIGVSATRARLVQLIRLIRASGSLDVW
jgi:hypothetical protein